MACTVIGARGRPGPVEDVMDAVRQMEERLNTTIQIFRADRIFGELHPKVAAEHANRSFAQGRNRSKHMGTEVLLYAAAERQINVAIEKLGIKPGIDEFCLLFGDGSRAEDLLELLNLQREDSVLDGPKDHTVFGISDEDIALVGEARIIDLIIERMALSELDR
ncbi:MAG: hypothetical protein AYK23_01180 [Candidatus Proteinoplasmatales archaeon SG8-5]|nr:MAG: hypothetical protein AYK23_01180 [Candidatus Proteinoplasmatales archaeon SG8-5]